jgi:hypothetical protein
LGLGLGLGFGLGFGLEHLAAEGHHVGEQRDVPG